MADDHDHHDHPHDHGERDPNSDLALEDRVRALESLLTERGLVSTDAIDVVVESYEADVGPKNGAQVVARAWTDPAFRDRLLTAAEPAIAEFDFAVGDMHLEVVENTPAVHNVVVCTLCSCYPWSLLGLPPTWYKSPEYRSRVVREPRAVLAEFGVELADDVEVKVWDANAELRYLVLPQRPAGTEGFDADALAERVTRDSMVGVDRLAP